ncbi:MAG: MBL fold metallo-hydrolase [Dehalococcoidia bacterium]|nr:MBL fold metallo-hydrolase [Dehalococcoidia bacterium]
MLKTTVGQIEVIALVDSIEAYPSVAVYPEAGDRIASYHQHLDGDGNVPLTFGCYALRDGASTVLVDTGWGPEHDGRLMVELREAGITPAEVSHVLFTHLHGDHTGWNIDRTSGKPNFPRATYLVPAGDWAHYSKQDPPSASFQRDVVPLHDSGQMELIEGERTITSGITAVPTPGHTPGHTSATIVSGTERGYVLGDVVISPVDLAEPDWPNRFDWDDDIARATRNSVLAALDDSTLIAASHLPDQGIGHFLTGSGKRSWRGYRPS